MYCGSCYRDNSLAVELLARGHDVTLLPLYTPTTTDENNVSQDRVLFGGISVHLQQHVALFRKTPRFLDRVWDSPAVIRTLAGRSISTDPRMLGDLTVSMLEGDRGVLRKEFDKLLDWLAAEPIPDVVNLPNSLLIGLAKPIRDALKRPVCCTLQGEDLFLEGLDRALPAESDRSDSTAGPGRRSFHPGERILRAGDVPSAEHSNRSHVGRASRHQFEGLRAPPAG